MQKPLRTLLVTASWLVASLWAVADAAGQTSALSPAGQVDAGRRIYEEGVLSDGSLLTGTHLGSITSSGALVACVNCHRPSGLGQVEGNTSVPPVAGGFLFGMTTGRSLVNMDPRVSKMFNQNHEPYSVQSFANALALGVSNKGVELSPAMPRYKLTDTDLQALAAYLRQLSVEWSPGVSNSSIRFATVIAPDVDPERKRLVKEMLQMIVRQKNGSTHTAADIRTRHHMTSAAEMILGTERKWELDIWEPQGPPDSWGTQLREWYRNKPVFALVSGVGNATWQPVHDFCEEEKVPCWFPSVKVPATTPAKYGLYFSEGVVLEARVMAAHMLAEPHHPQKVLQVYRDDGLGRAASKAFSQTLKASAVVVESRSLRADLPRDQALGEALCGSDDYHAMVFWMSAEDTEALALIKPVGQRRYFSTLLAGTDTLTPPPAWRSNAYLVSPYALPNVRATQLLYFNAWRNLRRIPLIDEALQSEVFFSMNFLSDSLSDMLENYYREYLVERAESMLGRREGSKAEQEARDRRALGNPGELKKKHPAAMRLEDTRVPLLAEMESTEAQGTTVYPRLGLGVGQRFAAKGAYVLPLQEAQSGKLKLEPEWIVPH